MQRSELAKSANNKLPAAQHVFGEAQIGHGRASFALPLSRPSHQWLMGICSKQTKAGPDVPGKANMRPSGGTGQPTKPQRRKPGQLKLHKKTTAPTHGRRPSVAELQDELNALKRELQQRVRRATLRRIDRTVGVNACGG